MYPTFLVRQMVLGLVDFDLRSVDEGQLAALAFLLPVEGLVPLQVLIVVLG